MMIKEKFKIKKMFSMLAKIFMIAITAMLIAGVANAQIEPNRQQTGYSGDTDPLSGDVDPSPFSEGLTEGFPFLIYQKSRSKI